MNSTSTTCSSSATIELDGAASHHHYSNPLFFLLDMIDADSARNLLLPGWLQLSFPTLDRAPIKDQHGYLYGYTFINTEDPEHLFHTLLVSLVSFTLLVRLVRYQLQSRKEAKSLEDSSSSLDWSSSTINNRNDDLEHNNSNNDTRNINNNEDDEINQSFLLKFLFSFTKSSSNLGLRERLQISPVKWRLRTMQVKFLAVFWLLRTSFWMSGPYFYAAYASKIVNGQPVTTSLISQISLVGYAAIAIVGPYLGKVSDQCGRKFGTILAALLYGMGSISTTSTSGALWILFVGRAIGGVGTSLLSASPEAWLVSEFKKQQQQVIDSKKKQKDDAKDLISDNDVAVVADPSWIQETFGMAYAYDSVVAILAGQLAGWAASRRGPTGPFQVSPLFLIFGGMLTAFFWDENKASHSSENNNNDKKKKQVDNGSKKQTIWDAIAVIRSDCRIALLGGVQALFEGAMYIFVMQWPPTMNRAIQKAFGESAITPYGTTFSCFMACCMAGSTIFGILAGKKKRKTCTSLEVSTIVLLGLAFLSLVAATITVGSFRSSPLGAADNQQRQDFMRLWQLIVAYFVFEACVGMYFPSIGTLRSKYLPDSHRSVIMTLFGVPLNIIVVTVFLFVHKLGNVGALAVAAIAVGLATACMVGLLVAEKRRKEHVRNRFKKIVRRVQRSLSKIKIEQEIVWQRSLGNRANFPTFSGPQFF